MRDFIRKPKNWIIVSLVLTIMAALFINLFSSANTNLPAYTPGTDVEPFLSSQTMSKSSMLETVLYKNQEYSFSMPVPGKWSFVVKNGSDSYIAPDGSMISFQVSEYDPVLNSISRESISSDIADINGILSAFSKLSNSSYAVLYEVDLVDYLELTTWDLQTTIRIEISYPATQQDLTESYMALLDQFHWEKGDPIPEGYSIYYSGYGNFEFLLPDGWDYGIEDGIFFATAPDESANYRVSVAASSQPLSISQIDYTNIMKQEKSEYMLLDFQSSQQILSAKASFTQNTSRRLEWNQILANGMYHYEILFQCEESAYETAYPTYVQLLDTFRVF